jgi:Domain of unknown function (DUF4349)
MKIQNLLPPAVLLTAISLFSCSNSDYTANASDQENEKSKQAVTDSVSYQTEAATNKLITQLVNPSANEKNDPPQIASVFSSSAARLGSLDSTHRFIRTADIRFRVDQVAKATYQIENIANRFGGYVADTKLASNLQSRYSIHVSSDSSLETMRYVVNNSITMRIPAKNLDTALKSLVPLIDYLDYRNVNMNDITLSVLGNQLTQKRNAKYQNRVSAHIDNGTAKLTDQESAELSLLNSEERSDNALLENLRLEDQILYATITLYIYQNETILQELIAREKTIQAYEPGLGIKLGNALEKGWRGLRILFVLMVTIWPLWLIGFGIWFGIRKYLKRKAVKA